MRLRLLLAFLVAGALALLGGSASAARTPVVAEVRAVGGLCAPGVTCAARTVLYADGRVVRQGRLLRRVSLARVREARRAIASIDLDDVRAHPFTGTCPVAYDGQELVYRLAGIGPLLRGCTWNLARVAGLRIVSRILGLP